MPRPPFARRTDWDRTENPLTVMLAKARESGRPLIDLTVSNPTACALADTEPLIALLGHCRGATYSPLPLGHPLARAAVAASYRERHLPAHEERIVLSASTSEAYSWLFKLLCEHGDKVLVPRPSYPLFEYLARLEDVELSTYPLVREEAFRIDMGALEREAEIAGERARAIVLVHPNNPTGTFVRRADAQSIARFAARRGMALIVDEVFAEYPHGELPPDALPSFLGHHHEGALTFVLGGLSKSLILPQCKLGWMHVDGPEELVGEAMARLELIADTYLSASTPVQLALPELLDARSFIQSRVRARISENLQVLDRVLFEAGLDAPIRRLPTEGGWSVILEVPRTRDEDAWVQALVQDHGIIVHPGYFFDMERDGFLVSSLLPEPKAFAQGIETLVRAVIAD